MDDEHKKTDSTKPRRPVLAGWSMDLAVAGIGLVGFVALMFLLSRWLFPVGLSLNDDGQGGSADSRRNRSGQELSYSGQNDGATTTVAELVTIRRNVQIKAHDSLAWSAAERGADLLDQDSLQTLSNSGAMVRLEDSSELKVGPNSLIVFQGGTTDPFTPRRTNSLVMMAGTLGGEFNSAKDNPLHLEVALPNGLARFIPGDSDAAVAFNINVNPDLSSSVSVHSGKGVVSVGGRTVSVERQHGVTISINGEVLEQGLLPAQPLVVRPRTRAVYRYRDIPPPLAFKWNTVAQVDNYRFRVARDAEMNDIVIDQRLSSSEFSYEGLQDGSYYWQVSALRGFIEGPPAETRQLRLVRDVQPPDLELLSSEYRNGQVIVRGRTDPGARVYVQGEAMTTATGSFEKTIDVDPGATLIVVEAVDSAGNVAYESQIISSKSSSHGGAR